MKTLEELKELVNNNEDWPLEANEIIELNGWIDETGTEYGICSDGKRRLQFNEEMTAEITEF